MAMSESSLVEYYNILFMMIEEHGWSGDYIENLMVFERDIFVQMLIEKIEKGTKKQEWVSQAGF